MSIINAIRKNVIMAIKAVNDMNGLKTHIGILVERNSVRLCSITTHFDNDLIGVQAHNHSGGVDNLSFLILNIAETAGSVVAQDDQLVLHVVKNGIPVTCYIPWGYIMEAGAPEIPQSKIKFTIAEPEQPKTEETKKKVVGLRAIK